MTMTIWFTHFIPMVQAMMKTPDAKAAVDKKWKKLETIPAWQLEKVSRARRRLFSRHKGKNKILFTTLMGIRHLKNAEFEPKLQKYEGRVVLRGDIAEDDLGAFSAFTEQGSARLRPK